MPKDKDPKATHIILCHFDQGDIMTLVAASTELAKRAEELGRELKDVTVMDIWLTPDLEHQVVVLVEAPTEPEARKVIELFDEIGEPDPTVLTISESASPGLVAAFNAHTKMV